MGEPICGQRTSGLILYITIQEIVITTILANYPLMDD